MVANLGLLLVQLREKVQQQREAAVVFLHLAQVPGVGDGSTEESFTWGRLSRSTSGGMAVCAHCIPLLSGEGASSPQDRSIKRADREGGEGSISYS